MAKYVTLPRPAVLLGNRVMRKLAEPWSIDKLNDSKEKSSLIKLWQDGGQLSREQEFDGLTRWVNG